MRAAIAAAVLRRPRDEWASLFAGSDACVAPVLSMAEAPDHPHNRARGVFVAQGGAVQPAPAPRFDRTPSELPTVAPAIGRDSRDILRSLGRSDAEIDALVAAGVVHGAPD